VGRGAWAGPVVAAAVVLPLPAGDLDLALALRGVRDSKTLSPRQRESLYPRIRSTAVAVGVGLASARFIDRLGIVAATRQAMEMAVANLGVSPDHLLIDARCLPGVSVPQRALIRGDAHVLSIAAASVVAKVFRDRLMVAMQAGFPGYGFGTHKGYGTVAHQLALRLLGACPEHRLSFAPLRRLRSTPAE